jgi:uncharacterized protein (TIGR00295 family)
MSRHKYILLLREQGCSEAVINHSKKVHGIAMKIGHKTKLNGEKVDLNLISIGAFLHDIGRCKTHGIDHAIRGAAIAQKLGLPSKVITIIERHIGAGIGYSEAKQLGLPEKDYIPQTIEEEIVAHADNLSDGTQIDQILTELRENGHDEAAKRMRQLHDKLSNLCGVNLDDLL